MGEKIACHKVKQNISSNKQVANETVKRKSERQSMVRTGGGHLHGNSMQRCMNTWAHEHAVKMSDRRLGWKRKNGMRWWKTAEPIQPWQDESMTDVFSHTAADSTVKGQRWGEEGRVRHNLIGCPNLDWHLGLREKKPKWLKASWKMNEWSIH